MQHITRLTIATALAIPLSFGHTAHAQDPPFEATVATAKGALIALCDGLDEVEAVLDRVRHQNPRYNAYDVADGRRALTTLCACVNAYAAETESDAIQTGIADCILSLGAMVE